MSEVLSALCSKLESMVASGDWPQSSIEDLVALTLLGSKIPTEELGLEARSLLARFAERIARTGAPSAEAQLEIYFQEHPLPPALLESLADELRGVTAEQSRALGARAAKLLARAEHSRPVEGSAASASSLFQLRLRSPNG